MDFTYRGPWLDYYLLFFSVGPGGVFIHLGLTGQKRKKKEQSTVPRIKRLSTFLFRREDGSSAVDPRHALAQLELESPSLLGLRQTGSRRQASGPRFNQERAELVSIRRGWKQQDDQLILRCGGYTVCSAVYSAIFTAPTICPSINIGLQ